MSDTGVAFDDVDVSRVQRRQSRLAARLGLGLVVFPVLVALLVGLGSEIFGYSRVAAQMGAILWMSSWLVAAPGALLASLLLSLRRELRIASVASTGGHLRLNGDVERTAYTAGNVESAMVVESEAGPEAEITLASGEVLYVRPAAAGGAEALVESLGFSGAKRRTVVSLGGARSPLWGVVRAVGLAALTTVVGSCSGAALAGELGFSPIGPWLFYTAGVLFTGLSLVGARRATPRRLVIGADGVLVERPFGSRFFPRGQIFGVEEIHGHVSLLLREGDEVKEVKLTSESPDRQAALVKRIRDALHEHSDGHDPRAALLARGDEPIAAWRERLRKLVSPAEGYRSRALPADVLLRAAADAEAPADVRVGAAMAIGMLGDQESREQLRIVTDAVAGEKLRVALESAAGDSPEEEAIAEACAEAERWSAERR